MRSLTKTFMSQALHMACLFGLIMISISCSNDDAPKLEEPGIYFTIEDVDYYYPFASTAPSGTIRFEFIDANRNGIPEVIEIEETRISVEGMEAIELSLARPELFASMYGYGPGGLEDIIFNFDPGSCPTYFFDERFSSPATVFAFKIIELGDLLDKSDAPPPDLPVAPNIFELYALNQLHVDFNLEATAELCDGTNEREIVSNGRIIIHP